MSEFLPLERPKFATRVDGYTLTWPDTGVAIEVDRLNEGDNGLTGELVFYDVRGQARLLFYTRLNLLYAQGVSGVVKTLSQRRSNVDWHGVMEQLTFLVIDKYRSGEPVIDLRAVPTRQATRWLLEPFLEQDSATVLFADGGIGKSSLALAMAVQIASGGQHLVGKLRSQPGPVLYYDWESDPAVHAERFRAICAGMNLEDNLPPVYYRRMVASLPESAATMRKDVAKYKACLAVIDSMGAARGGEPESADSTIRLFNAARSLGVAWLGVDHITKNGAEGGGAKKPFGCYSADTEVLSRRGWLRHDQWHAGEQIVCFDRDSGSLVWRVPERLFVYDYDGPMYRLQQRSTDALMTPDHKLVLRPNWRTPASPKINGMHPTRQSWELRPVNTLTEADWQIPWVTACEDGDNLPPSFEIGERQFPADAFVRLIGWWVAEGSFNDGQIVLSQGAGPLATAMADLLAQLGLRFNACITTPEQNHGHVHVQHLRTRREKALANWFEAECGRGCQNKRLPTGFLHWPTALRQTLLDALLDGDGCRLRSGYCTYHTVSKQLADDVQALALSLGRPAMLSTYPCRSGWRTSYVVGIGLPNRPYLAMRPSDHLSIVPYTGKVYCFSTPTGAYLTRRNGKVAIQGNSIYTHNLARVTWGMERTKESSDDGSSVICLTNHKSNHGHLQRPVVMRLHYIHADDDQLLAIYFRPEELLETEFADKLPLKERILRELRSGAATPEAVAESLGVKTQQVRVRLSELKRAGAVISFPDRRYGLVAAI